MTRTTFARKLAFVLLAVFVASTQLSAAQHHHYKLIDVGTFGGPASALSNPFPVEDGLLNNRGAMVGLADTLVPDPFAPNCFFDCFVEHAFRWEDGTLTDLGALPGDNSSYAFWTSENGLVVGISENGAIDPLTGYPEAVAVLWKHGQIIDLGTLGGSASAAGAVNNRGQVVGAALNTIPDSFVFGPFPPDLFFPAATQMHAFLWQRGTMRDLGTLGGPDSGAFYLNERGQVAGYSYTDSTPNATTGVPTLDPFFWQNGTMQDLGTLGGTIGFPDAMNERGQVVGQSNTAGDVTAHPFLWEPGKTMKDLGTLGGTFGRADGINAAGDAVGIATTAGDQAGLAFLWKKKKMTNLGTLDGYPCSEAFGVNAQEQVVGAGWDCGPEFIHAFLWENGEIIDLNTFTVPGSGVELRIGDSINDRGEIAAQGALASGDLHAFILIPCDENHPGLEGCDYKPVEVSAAVEAAPVPFVRSASPPAHMRSTPFRLRVRPAIADFSNGSAVE